VTAQSPKNMSKMSWTEPARRDCRRHRRRIRAVVVGAPFGVREDLVGLGDLFEARFGLWIVVRIGVVLRASFRYDRFNSSGVAS